MKKQPRYSLEVIERAGSLAQAGRYAGQGASISPAALIAGVAWG